MPPDGKLPRVSLDTSDPKPDNRELHERFTVVKPQVTPRYLALPPSGYLPEEMQDELENACHMHVMAFEPSWVLPPGKSLVSVIARPFAENNRSNNPTLTLHDRIEEIVHRAFWDEALDTLSDPEPSSQLPRLRSLYKDLADALARFFPATHPILVTLAAPLSPISSPLYSAAIHLREILGALRQKCAPVREAAIDDLIRPLDNLPPNSSTEDLAKLVVETSRSILHLSKVMKNDWTEVFVGSLSEEDVKATLRLSTRMFEREIAAKIWSQEEMQESWSKWLDELQPSFDISSIIVVEPRLKWIIRLVQALGKNIAVSCKLPNKVASISSKSSAPPPAEQPAPIESNFLPPPFIFSISELLYAQNYLQALVIAACLRSLARLPPSPKVVPQSTGSDHAKLEAFDFMQRIWLLLKAEVDEREGAGETKLVNLSDEVVRARQLTAAIDSSTFDADEESRLRAAVDRTLRPHDPVFVLFQKRLFGALASWLIQRLSQSSTSLPERLQAGFQPANKRPRLASIIDLIELELPGTTQKVNKPAIEVAIKSSEDPILLEAAEEIFKKVEICVDWVTDMWKDVVPVKTGFGSEASEGRPSNVTPTLQVDTGSP